jgi:zinc/manganese transport system substrate-binding protein
VALALGMMSRRDGENAECGDQLFDTGDITQVGGDHVNVTTLVGPDGDRIPSNRRRKTAPR